MEAQLCPVVRSRGPGLGFLGAIQVRETRLFLGMGVRLRYLATSISKMLDNPLTPTSSIRYSSGIYLRFMYCRSPESLHLATVHKSF